MGNRNLLINFRVALKMIENKVNTQKTLFNNKAGMDKDILRA